MSHVRILEKVPQQLMDAVKAEVASINWGDYAAVDKRGENPVFSTSTSVHIRVHDAPAGTPHTVQALSEYVECRYTMNRTLFPAVDDLVGWIYTTVSGTRLGRIMIVRLESGGDIAEHIDPGKYFQHYHRFHVPVVTNSGVKFFGPGRETSIHMPEGRLSQLDNRKLHSAINEGDGYRVHVIVDIDSEDPQYNF